jgi:peptide/nickel transport system substrate-binding protein
VETQSESLSENPPAASFSQKVRKAFLSFSLFGKIGLIILFVVFAASGLTFLYLFNDSFKVNIPETGGTLKEGVVGFPKSVSPLSATDQTDKDLSALIYSGLLSQNADGSFSPDLAKSYTVSADGRSYNFILRTDATFQDGTALTADDVLYTVASAKNDTTNPSLAAAWQGVTAAKASTHEVKITLPAPSNYFLNNFTLGIISKKNASSTTPVGSGPYKVKIKKNDITGMPEYYELTSFKNFTLGRPYINTLIVRFYANEKDLVDGYHNGEIDSASDLSLATTKLLENSKTMAADIPVDRTFGVFFNEKNLTSSSALGDPVVRQALNIAIDRGNLISTVFGGYGFPLYLPAPTSLLQPSSTSSTNVKGWQDINGVRITDAEQLLHQAGWQENAEGIMQKQIKGKDPLALSFTLDVPNVPELVSTAEYLKNAWLSIGAEVYVKVDDNADFSGNVIAGRKYDAVLYGQEIGTPGNLSPFWHTITTSTSTSASLSASTTNLSLYSNKQVDTLLDEAGKATSSETWLSEAQQAEDQIMSDTPAIFLYQPGLPYVLPKSVLGTKFTTISSPEQRFDLINDWHIETERVWKIFAK